MKKTKKDANVMIGERLRKARKNLGFRQEDFAYLLNVSEEHYRKIELGATALTMDKVIILYKEYSIDPSFLLLGKAADYLDINTFIANSSREQREEFWEDVFSYLRRIMMFS